MATADSRAANEQVVREMNEAVWSADGRPDAIDDHFAEEVVAHEPGETLEGREALKTMAREFREAFPDMSSKLEFTVCERDLVTTYYTVSGTNTGSLWGMEPTGKSGEIHGIAIYRIDDGMIVESWHEHDRVGMLQQLGVIPEFGAPEA
jgi:predicted ester cyclase